MVHSAPKSNAINIRRLPAHLDPMIFNVTGKRHQTVFRRAW